MESGKMKLYMSNVTGTKFFGKIKNNKRSGYGILITRNHVYCGNWQKDKKTKYGTLASKEGLYKGNWENDKRNGKGIQVYANSKVYDGDWKNNQYNGIGVIETTEP